MPLRALIIQTYKKLTFSPANLSEEERQFIDEWTLSQQRNYFNLVRRVLLYVFTFSTVGIYLRAPMPQRPIEMATHGTVLLIMLVWNLLPKQFSKVDARKIFFLIELVLLTGSSMSIHIVFKWPHSDPSLIMISSYFIGITVLSTMLFPFQDSSVLIMFCINLALTSWAYWQLQNEGRLIDIVMLMSGFTSVSVGLFYSNIYRTRREILGELHNRKSLLQSERLRFEAVEQQLLLANQIQDCLTPPQRFTSPQGVEARFYQKKFHPLGGDWMALRTNQNGELIFAVADATGKGVSAALVVHAVQSLWAQALEKPNFNPRHWLESVNNTLLILGQNKPHTLTLGILVVSQTHIEYYSAGHVPAYIFSGDSPMSLLFARGNLVGYLPSLELKPASYILNPSKTYQIILGTDGALEKGSRTRDKQVRRLAQDLRAVGQEAFNQCQSLDDKLVIIIDIPRVQRLNQEEFQPLLIAK